ncbi:MAG TPA: hypothetical protein VFM54_18120 [Micromonosporaceae bacterium]|nr:hypothetical protein [Micromonosporaceae bacterium]
MDGRQLDGLRSQGVWSVFGRELRVSNLDKVLFPARPGEAPVTKRDLLRYAAQVAPTVLPYLTRRALNMHRYPNGAQAKGLWHKELPDHAPAWLPRWTNLGADPGETQTYLVVDEPAALVWAANFGALEWHAWTSPVDHPHQPAYALVDLDPGEATGWQDLLVLARLHRTAFDHLGLCARAKLTRLDYTQNAVNKTLVAPYSPRPAPGAPVSAPIEWDELDDPDLTPDAFTIRTVLQRIADKGDLFRDVLHHPQQLPPLQ